VVAINSGANMTFERLQYITERTLIGSGHEALFSVRLPEKPGALEQFCRDLQGHNISEFNYRKNSTAEAHILAGVTTHNPADAASLAGKLVKKGYEVADFTADNLAKEHVRHMIGGKGATEHEQLVHFDFPERPGALGDFLARLGQRWNISLFHYRGMGADIGRVLIGFEVPLVDASNFKKFLSETGFDYELVTGNQAYKVFLQ
jgi:threonine dehydratase